MSTASHTRGRCRVMSAMAQAHDLPGRSTRGRSPGRSSTSPDAGTGGCRPPICVPGWPAAGARAGHRRRHTMVTGQPPVHRSGHRCAPGRLPGPPARRKEAASPRARPPILASPSQAHSHLLPADRSAPTSEPTDSGRPLPPPPDPAPHHPKEPAHRTPPPPRQSSPSTHDTKDHLLPEPTAESLRRHEPIQPRFSNSPSSPPQSKKHQAAQRGLLCKAGREGGEYSTNID